MADTKHPDSDHPLKPTRPSVPPEAQPRSTQSHPGQVAGELSDHDETVAHEHSDVNVRAIATFIIGLIVVGIVIHIGLWALMGLYARQAAEADPRITPLAVPSGTLPPEPRLLTNEPAALQQVRGEEDALLQDLERAKQQVVGTLPARAGGQAPGESASRAASRMDTSSGRQQ